MLIFSRHFEIIHSLVDPDMKTQPSIIAGRGDLYLICDKEDFSLGGASNVHPCLMS